MNTLKTIYALIFLIVLASCGANNDSKEKSQYYKKQETQTQQLELSIEASGVIEAISSVEIKSKASGEILFLGADVGDFVEKGAMLGQIDQRTPTNILDQSESDLDAAKVRLENAEAQYNRGKALHDNASISDKDFEDIQENFAQAKSTLVRTEVSFENAKIALDDTVVRSPISGTIISRPVEVGQVISSPTSAVGGGTLLMPMADLSKVRVRALVDEIDVGIEPLARVEQNVTTFPVLIDINNDDNLLLLGMNTDVVIEILNEQVSMSIPSMSLRTRKDIYSAANIVNIPNEEVDSFLVDRVKGENFNKFIVIKDTKNGPQLAWVKIGISDLSNVEVIEGLSTGETVYILPSKSLVDYQRQFRERVEASFSFG